MIRNKKCDLIHYIIKQTRAHNMDNISRTKAYQTYYFSHPEIKWSLLASVVSRNAGYSMTDLSLPPFLNMLGSKELRHLFTTYERANWLIFSDAFPQLLIYEWSKRVNKPLFRWLEIFNISRYMIAEWEYFWKERDQERLIQAQIINEQNTIHDPVIRQSFFKQQIFRKLPYLLQTFLGMNAVLLPTRSTYLYGLTVKQFTDLTGRINLGKHIAATLFSSDVYPRVLDFVHHSEPTGSRYEYEPYLGLTFPHAPPLRCVYPIITHDDHIRKDWFKRTRIPSKWISSVKTKNAADISRRYYQKRHLLFAYNHIKQIFT